MRPALLSYALAAAVFAAPQLLPTVARAQSRACTIEAMRLCGNPVAAPTHARHLAHLRYHRHLARYGQPYHIPRFSQAEAEAEVHTVYPYRTGILAPWPGFYEPPPLYPRY